jgi:hypothetical protein
VCCCSCRRDYARRVEEGGVALSPLEVAALLEGRAGVEELRMVATVKQVLGDARVERVRRYDGD